MADVTPGILTNGLGADHSAMIIGSFRLGFFTVDVIVPPSGGGGGPYPGDAWNKFDTAWDIYQPTAEQTTTEQPYILPPEPKLPVTIRVTFQEKVVEKVYLVTPKQSKMLVHIVNLVNSTQTRIVVSVKNVMSRISRALTRITNIHSKSKK